MENKKSSLFSQVEPYIKGFQFPLLVSFVGVILSSVITVYGPVKLKEITNLITEGMRSRIDLKAISNIALFLAVLFVKLRSIFYHFICYSAFFKTFTDSHCGEN